MTDEKYEAVMAVNVYGPLAAMRKAVQVLLAQEDGGNTINVSSIGSMRQAAGPAYGASKAALNAISKNTAYMYKSESIRVNVIDPGGINTGIASSTGRPNMTGYAKVQPVPGLSPAPGEAQDIANAALFLASDDSPYISASSCRSTAAGPRSKATSFENENARHPETVGMPGAAMRVT